MKNTLIALFGFLAIGFCCFGHIVLAGIGGAGILTGLLTKDTVLIATGFVILVVGILYFSIKRNKVTE